MAPNELKERLDLKELELNSLLEITQAINSNIPEDALYKIFDFTLRANLRIKKIALYVLDDFWNCKVNYGKAPKLEDLEKEFDIIVDCTGFHRMYLPKLEKDFFLPTYEYKIEYDKVVPFDDFFIKPFGKK